MHVTQMLNGYGQAYSIDPSRFDPSSGQSSLALVTGFLDAALRMWEDDRTRAKSQVKVAAAMLRDYAGLPSVGGSIVEAPAVSRGLAPWQTRKVKEFIDASLDSIIRLRDCAAKARLSTSHFSRAFKITFGTTVCHYIRHCRVERAQQLMLSSKEPLSQIALACGFADQAHYCRVFRNVVGLSPHAWRRQNMKVVLDE